MYFLGLLDPPGRAEVVAHIDHRMGAELARLEELGREIDGGEVPEDLADVAHFQRLALEWGIASHRHARAWMGDHLAPSAPSHGG
ncbi:MAG: hypothetical protein Q4C85_09310 [Actinomyces sp.]|uniref:hypothetical protein n=1 Tax=Actinomyces sp. TaxID=29317 RepID=UPI0026DB7812|nr:hypothetical protein [Actinomyces sp.]MDO4243935.1 hypothetical protein [Actinomyces sp.]